MADDPFARMMAAADRVLQAAEQSQEAREAHLCRSEHVGAVAGEGEKAERVELSLTLVSVLGPFSGQWGDRFGYVFHQADTCNVVMWWSGSKQPAEVGETKRFTVSITKHDLYEGIKQTLVARIKPVEEKIVKAKARRKKAQEEGDGEA